MIFCFFKIKKYDFFPKDLDYKFYGIKLDINQTFNKEIIISYPYKIKISFWKIYILKIAIFQI